jgi:hypothetical protein
MATVRREAGWAEVANNDLNRQHPYWRCLIGHQIRVIKAPDGLFDGVVLLGTEASLVAGVSADRLAFPSRWRRLWWRVRAFFRFLCIERFTPPLY